MNKTYTVKEIQSGKLEEWTTAQILDEINRDRSNEWQNYNESDWIEGWLEFCEGDIYTIPALQSRNMKTKTYYHLFDLQNSQLMATGSNSESLEELKEALLSYVSIDYPSEDDGSEEWQDWQTIQRMSVQELCEMWEFSIEQTPHKI